MKKSRLATASAVAVTVIGVIVAAAVAHWLLSDRVRLTTEPRFTGLARSVSVQDLVSDRDPAATLRFDPAFRYLGGQQFVLYGLADAEQHFFVQTAPDGRLGSLYWVQYEAYLPDQSGRYDYEHSPRRVVLDGQAFFADTAIVAFDHAKERPRGTDGDLARRFLAARGLRLPEDFAYARLVWLTDVSQRKELMIIFIEDLAARGLTAAALAEGGADASRRAEVEQSHIDRIKRTLNVLPAGPPA